MFDQLLKQNEEMLKSMQWMMNLDAFEKTMKPMTDLLKLQRSILESLAEEQTQLSTEMMADALVAAHTTQYNNKSIDLTDRVNGLLVELVSVTSAIIFDGPCPKVKAGEISRPGCKVIAYDDAVSGDHALAFEHTPFNHPGFILYSSGTTGVPKCIVHSQGGALIQLVKEHRYHVDIQPFDRVFYYTTCGWMMWNWLLASLASKATIVTYDGSPFVRGAIPPPGFLDSWHCRRQLNQENSGPAYLHQILQRSQCPLLPALRTSVDRCPRRIRKPYPPARGVSRQRYPWQSRKSL